MTANLSREQELAFWREKTEQLRVRVMEIARKANPMDAAFPRSLEGTLNEWSSEADDEAQRRAGELDSRFSNEHSPAIP